jgi:CheY-like chemotaxis protein
VSATHSDRPDQGAPHQAQADQADGSEPYLVLIVDDEPTIVDALEFAVTENGYHAMTANNGKAALALAQQRWPALVMTDLMMPQMDGAALIAALHQVAGARQVPLPHIILLSAASPQALENSGADMIIPKPFDLAQVEAALRQFLSPAPTV